MTHEHGVRSALWLPLFDELSDPVAVARLAAEAEEAGWHGAFVWDHLHWQTPVRQVADAGATLAAIATGTEQLRLGPMVMPVGVDPLPYVEAGATWWLPEFAPDVLSLDAVRGVLRDGPLAP